MDCVTPPSPGTVSRPDQFPHPCVDARPPHHTHKSIAQQRCGGARLWRDNRGRQQLAELRGSVGPDLRLILIQHAVLDQPARVGRLHAASSRAVTRSTAAAPFLWGRPFQAPSRSPSALRFAQTRRRGGMYDVPAQKHSPRLRVMPATSDQRPRSDTPSDTATGCNGQKLHWQSEATCVVVRS